MCDDPDSCIYPSVYRSVWRRARRRSRCYACNEPILPRHVYRYTFGVWDGDASDTRHCSRCWAILTAIRDADVEPQLDLNCGSTWVDAFSEDPPENVQALAFALPSDFNHAEVRHG